MQQSTASDTTFGAAHLLPSLAQKIAALSSLVPNLPAARRERLAPLAAELRDRRRAGVPLHLNFICTHNSRRSQLGQVWAAVAAFVNDVPQVVTYSGGTETTAFNPRAVAALERAGLRIEREEQEAQRDNPLYFVHFSESAPALQCFSKLHDAPSNPSNDFIAIMTCGEADRSCPVIPRAVRIPLLYEDPKISDETPAERATYDARSDQIATEMLWVFGEGLRS